MGSRNLSRVPGSVGRGLRQLRILHIDSGREWRGGQRQVLLLADGLRHRTHDPVILAPPESPLLQRARDIGIKTEPLVMRYDWDLRAALNVRERVQDSSVDIVHAHDARAHAIARVSLIGLSSHATSAIRAQGGASQVWQSRHTFHCSLASGARRDGRSWNRAAENNRGSLRSRISLIEFDSARLALGARLAREQRNLRSRGRDDGRKRCGRLGCDCRID